MGSWVMGECFANETVQRCGKYEIEVTKMVKTTYNDIYSGQENQVSHPIL